MTERDDCADTQARLTALLDDELATDEAAAVRAHLRECAACREEWEGLVTTHALAARWPEGGVPDLWPSLRAQIGPPPWEEVLAELRALRVETQALRAEVARLRRELSARPAPPERRSTPLDLPYVPRVSHSPFKLV